MAFPSALVDPYLALMMPNTLVTNHIPYLEAYMQPHLQDPYSSFHSSLVRAY